MNIKKLFLLIIVTVLLVGLSYATEVSNDTSSSEDTHSIETSTTKELVVNSNTPKEKDTSITNIDTKNTISKQRNKTIKTENNGYYDVNKFNTLHDALTNDTYSTLTLNLKSDIKLTNYTKLNTAIKTLTINGNGKTVNGDNLYQFLHINAATKVTIKNIKITNCFTDSYMEINGSMFPTSADRYGGAIYNNGGTLTIINSTLNNNIAPKRNYGGAIYTNGGTLTITNSTLNNNKAGGYGGAIFTTQGTLTITNSTLNNNKAKGGGAICNLHGIETLTIIDCTFNNNKATVAYGGAIDNMAHLTMKNCIITNNFAANFGGGVFTQGERTTILDSIFKNNAAKRASVIFIRGEYNYILNNTFKQNRANTTGQAIINYCDNTIIKNNINDDTSKDSSTMIMTGRNVTITDNIFLDGRNSTEITINKIPNTQYTDNVMIKGTLKTKGIPLKSGVIVTINDKEYRTNTDANGTFIYKYKTPAVGTNNVSVSFEDDDKYYGSTAKTTFNVTPKTTKITINKIANTQYSDNTTIKGTFKTTTGTPLKSATLTIQLNGKKIGTTKTNTNGTYTYKINTKTIGKNNITITFQGNTWYKTTTTKTTFNVAAK